MAAYEVQGNVEVRLPVFSAGRPRLVRVFFHHGCSAAEAQGIVAEFKRANPDLVDVRCSWQAHPEYF